MDAEIPVSALIVIPAKTGITSIAAWAEAHPIFSVNAYLCVILAKGDVIGKRPMLFGTVPYRFALEPKNYDAGTVEPGEFLRQSRCLNDELDSRPR